MSRRYWGIGLAALIFAGSLQAQPSGNSEGNHTSPAKTAQPSKDSPQAVSALDRVVDELSKTRKEQRDPYGDERNQRERRDIIAQENMADWAGAMFWAVIAQTVLAGGALLALICDLRQNRKSAELQLRAYVTVNGAGIFDYKTRKPYYKIVWKNVGQTPAYNLRTAIFVNIAPADSPPPFPDASDLQDGIFHTVGPQCEHVFVGYFGDDIKGKREKLRLGELNIYVVGLLEYETVFGEVWRVPLRERNHGKFSDGFSQSFLFADDRPYFVKKRDRTQNRANHGNHL